MLEIIFKTTINELKMMHFLKKIALENTFFFLYDSAKIENEWYLNKKNPVAKIAKSKFNHQYKQPQNYSIMHEHVFPLCKLIKLYSQLIPNFKKTFYTFLMLAPLPQYMDFKTTNSALCILNFTPLPKKIKYLKVLLS